MHQEGKLPVSENFIRRLTTAAHRGLPPSGHRGVSSPVAGPSRVTPDAARETRLEALRLRCHNRTALGCRHSRGPHAPFCRVGSHQAPLRLKTDVRAPPLVPTANADMRTCADGIFDVLPIKEPICGRIGNSRPHPSARPRPVSWRWSTSELKQPGFRVSLGSPRETLLRKENGEFFRESTRGGRTYPLDSVSALPQNSFDEPWTALRGIEDRP